MNDRAAMRKEAQAVELDQFLDRLLHPVKLRSLAGSGSAWRKYLGTLTAQGFNCTNLTSVSMVSEPILLPSTPDSQSPSEEHALLPRSR